MYFQDWKLVDQEHSHSSNYNGLREFQALYLFFFSEINFCQHVKEFCAFFYSGK